MPACIAVPVYTTALVCTTATVCNTAPLLHVEWTARGIDESFRVRPHHRNFSHLRPGGSS
eukprot:6538822-Pyramimonas_sp.AAC.1